MEQTNHFTTISLTVENCPKKGIDEEVKNYAVKVVETAISTELFASVLCGYILDDASISSGVLMIFSYTEDKCDEAKWYLREVLNLIKGSSPFEKELKYREVVLRSNSGEQVVSYINHSLDNCCILD